MGLKLQPHLPYIIIGKWGFKYWPLKCLKWSFTPKNIQARVSARNVWERGSKRGGGPPPGEKKSDFFIFVLKMTYFNWNDSKIWNIFLFSLPTRGDTPVVLSEGGGGSRLAEPCKPLFDAYSRAPNENPLPQGGLFPPQGKSIINYFKDRRIFFLILYISNVCSKTIAPPPSEMGLKILTI